MRTHRFIYAVVLAALFICPQIAAASPESTLLSGYGGPGQGNQAILGSTLIGAGGKGGGKGTGGGPGPSAPAPVTSIALPLPAPSSSHRSAGHAPKRPATRHASKAPAPAYQRATPASDRGGGGTLGLTGADVLFGVLALGALALTALLTMRLAGRSGRAEGTQ